MVKNLKDLMTRFQDEQACRDYLVQQRWNGVPTCPYCGSQKSYVIEGGRRFKCGNKECYKKYSVTVGTVFEASNIPLTTWFAAMYIITAHKKGISSVQLGKDLGVTQKSAWFMLHRIRESLQDSNPEMLTGTVEVDETFLGRKFRSEFQGLSEEQLDKLARQNQKVKGVVIGAIQRGGKVILKAEKDLTAANTAAMVKQNVSPDAILMTDQSTRYKNGLKNWERHTVDHSVREWVRGNAHTNNIESFWSLFKRGVFGTYHQISAKHLQMYCNEFAYRFNSRELKDGFRFQLALLNVEGRLTYKQLINGNGKESSTEKNIQTDQATGE